MKLEVGMYVRTKKYGIAKIICGTSNKFNIDVFKKDGCTLRCQKERDILKASFNIIDLIEVGDYVNGLQVYKVDRECCRITLNGGKYGEEFRLTYLRPVLGKNMGIKSIVTKEQYKNIEYRIGE